MVAPLRFGRFLLLHITGGILATLCILSVVFLPDTASAQIWNGSLSNSWGTPANWTGGLPTSAGAVAITSTTNNPVILDVAGQAGTLTLGATNGLDINDSESLTVNGGAIGNAGAIQMNASGGNTDLIIAGGGTTTLNGGGTLTLSNNTNNRIYATSAGTTLTNTNNTISGAGQIGVVGSGLTVNNAGTINANQSNALTLAGTIVNTGVLESTSGGTLGFGAGTVDNTNHAISAIGANSALQFTNTSVTNTGGTISANGAGGSVNLNSASINNGTLQGSNGAVFNTSGASTLSGTIALNSVMNQANNSSLTLASGGGIMSLNLNFVGAALNMNSAGSFTDLILSGTNGTVYLDGLVTLSNNANNRIYAVNSGMTLNNFNTIQGAGQIANVGSAITLNNYATIDANQSTALILGGNGSVLNNDGGLQAEAGSLLHIEGGSGTFTNFSGNTLTGGGYGVAGTVKIDALGTTGGEIVNNAATIDLSGNAYAFTDSAGNNALSAFSNNLHNFDLEDGASFTAASAFTNEGFVDISGTGIFSVNGGSSAYTQSGGGFTVDDGTLSASATTITGGVFTGSGVVNNALINGGTVNAGDNGPGTLTVNGTYQQTSNGILAEEILNGNAFDLLTIDGGASLNGNLSIFDLAGSSVFSGETFRILTATGDLTGGGQFFTGNHINVPGGFFEVLVNPHDVTLQWEGPSSAPSPEPSTWFLSASGLAIVAAFRLSRRN